jgi:hypothetical protein
MVSIEDHPSKQLAGLAAAKSTDTSAALALVGVFFGSLSRICFNIKVGRFLPRKVDEFFIEGRTLDQTAALKSLTAPTA